MNLKTHPLTVDDKTLVALQESFTLSFGYGNGIIYRHGYRDGNTVFELIYGDELPNHLIPLASKMHLVEVDGKPAYYFRAEISTAKGIVEDFSPSEKKQIYNNVRALRKDNKQSMQQAVTSLQPKPAIVLPPSITIPEIAAKMVSKRYYFFTGAGLSASVVPDWDGLMRQMGYQRERSNVDNLQDTLNIINTQLPEMMQAIHNAHQAFIYGTPTAGHNAIASMTQLLRRPALTDNRDLIQQRAGTSAIHVGQLTPFSGVFKPSVHCNYDDIDGIIVCGMGGDRRGFITWLKENNPKAEVIHMDLASSRNVYADRFIQGDLQMLLPELEKQVAAQLIASSMSDAAKQTLVPNATPLGVSGQGAQIAKGR